jgi:hypothetical protein
MVSPNWKTSDTFTRNELARNSDSSDPPMKLPDITNPSTEPAPIPKKTTSGETERSAPPPNDPKKLQEELKSLLNEREQLTTPPSSRQGAADERAQLRDQLIETLNKLETRKKPSSAPAPVEKKHPEKPPAPKLDLPDGTKAPDAVRFAANLYMYGEIEAAYKTFKQMDLNGLPKEDRTFVQYMTACCLRRLGKSTQAAPIFRDIAEAKDDGFLTECALWQLSGIRYTQELETQLEQLRSRRKTK